MKMRRFLSTFFCLFLIVGGAHAADLGMTPSHVVGLWKNINDSLVPTAFVVSGEDALARQFAAIQPTRFDGKKPSDVLKNVAMFRAKLNKLRAGADLPPVAEVAVEDGALVTPRHVFLNSGFVLDGLLDWMVRTDATGIPVSPYCKREKLSGLTPSDVYSHIELAKQKIDLILRAKS
jgi:hypothetical protein